MNQIDLWRVARLLITKHDAEEAISVAAGRATDLAVESDQKGALVFRGCIREWTRAPGRATS